MSAEQIIASLRIDVDDDIIDQLDDHLEVVDEIQALEDHVTPQFAGKVALAGDGSHIYFKVNGGPTGKGECHKVGAGAFAGSSLPTLHGSYSLKVGRVTVKLYKGGRKVWQGVGAQKGLSGTWDVTFK